MVKVTKPQEVPLEIGIDWFHFETRIRKVIHEVVDPLTKKQFKCFEGLEQLKKNFTEAQARHDDTVYRLDRVTKKNDSIDVVDRKIKEAVR